MLQATFRILRTFTIVGNAAQRKKFIKKYFDGEKTELFDSVDDFSNRSPYRDSPYIYIFFLILLIK